MQACPVPVRVSSFLRRTTRAAGRGSALAALMMAVAIAAAGAGENPDRREIIRSVVGISALVPEQARTAKSLGTVRTGNGVVIDDNGLVLTIGYLILEATNAAVTDSEGKLVPAAIVAYDHNTGFGLLRARIPLGLKPVQLGKSADLKEGNPVIVIAKGGPFPVMPAGVVSRRSFAGYWEYLLDKAIFTAPPHPAYGGAALIDANGRLVGIGSLVVGDAVSGEQPLPGNMFVPIDLLKPILAELLENGRAQAPPRPWLGVYTDDSQGRVFVTRVADGGPADKAGIKPGDVIMGVGGKWVRDMGDFLRKVWAKGHAGTEISVDILQPSSGVLDIRKIPVLSQDRDDWLKMATEKK